MKKKELKAMSAAELKEKMAELRKELVKLNAQIATGITLKSPGQVRQLRRALAQMLTELKLKSEEVSSKA